MLTYIETDKLLKSMHDTLCLINTKHSVYYLLVFAIFYMNVQYKTVQTALNDAIIIPHRNKIYFYAAVILVFVFQDSFPS